VVVGLSLPQKSFTCQSCGLWQLPCNLGAGMANRTELLSLSVATIRRGRRNLRHVQRSFSTALASHIVADKAMLSRSVPALCHSTPPLPLGWVC
jgi:hypothetical protein